MAETSRLADVRYRPEADIRADRNLSAFLRPQRFGEYKAEPTYCPLKGIGHYEAFATPTSWSTGSPRNTE